MDALEKKRIKSALEKSLRVHDEVRKIVVFGSFNESSTPHDIDVAVFQNSNADYLTLAMKYRKSVRSVPTRLPMDIVPIQEGASSLFLEEIAKGEVIYERG